MEPTDVSPGVPDEGKMPRTEPGADRASLGFAEAVMQSFAFLLQDFGFRLTDSQSTFVRYESDSVRVNVFHGRGSYELGVEIGRPVEVNGERVEEKFQLGDIMALDHEHSAVGYRPLATTEKEPLGRFVAQLAEWTRSFAGSALKGDAAVFDRLRIESVRRSDELQDGWRASRLRSLADDAWRKQDWGRVVDAYSEIKSELHSVDLKASEIARCRYARKRLGPTTG